VSPSSRPGGRALRHASTILALVGLSPADHALAEAQQNFEEQVNDARAAPTPTSRNGNWVFVPIPVSNPTVGTGLQAAVLYLHPLRPGQDAAHSTTTGAGVMATDSGSRLAGAFHDASLANDRFRLSGFAGVGKFNLSFYGVGDGSALAGKSVPYEFSGGVGQVRGEARVPGTDHWFAGLTYLFVEASVTFKTSEAIAELPDLSGTFNLAALGPQVTFDSRDSNYYPTLGTYSRLGWANYDPRWGSDFSYDKLDFFYNHYLPVATNAVLALRTRLQAASEDTPFLDLPTLDMRGFARDRYRDRRTLSVTAEGRYKFRPRWGVVAFLEAGRFAETFGDLWDARTITTFGAGLRWQVTAERPMHIGLDAAVSTDDRAVFIQVGERF
jgi:Omp85 superfamily domain